MAPAQDGSWFWSAEKTLMVVYSRNATISSCPDLDCWSFRPATSGIILQLLQKIAGRWYVHVGKFKARSARGNGQWHVLIYQETHGKNIGGTQEPPLQKRLRFVWTSRRTQRATKSLKGFVQHPCVDNPYRGTSHIRTPPP